jgi:hypothetical protein
MDPCNPGVDVKNARSYIRVKMGIPKALVEGASKEAICRAIKRCKKTAGTPMPPMMSDRVGNHTIYYHNPRGIELKGKDYKDLLVGKPTLKDLKRVAKKLGLSDLATDALTLKGTIINLLKDAKTPEPIMIPAKKRTGSPTVNAPANTATNIIRPPANNAVKNAIVTLNNNNASKNDLVKVANKLVETPPSKTLANSIAKNSVTRPGINAIRKNAPIIERRFNRMLRPESDLQRVVQKPGVSREELRHAIKNVVRVQQQRPSTAPRPPTAPPAPRPPTALNELRRQRTMNMQLQRTQRNQKTATNAQVSIDKQLRTAMGNFSSPTNALIAKAVKNAENNPSVRSILAKVSQSRIANALKRVETAQSDSEQAQKVAEKNNTPKNVNDASEKAKVATLKIKELVGQMTATNENAILAALKKANSNNDFREKVAPHLKNVNKNKLNKITKKYRNVSPINELRQKMGVGPAGRDEDILRRAVENISGEYLNTLSRVDKSKLKVAIKDVHGKGFFKTDAQKEYFKKLLNKSNIKENIIIKNKPNIKENIIIKNKPNIKENIIIENKPNNKFENIKKNITLLKSPTPGTVLGNKASRIENIEGRIGKVENDGKRTELTTMLQESRGNTRPAPAVNETINTMINKLKKDDVNGYIAVSRNIKNLPNASQRTSLNTKLIIKKNTLTSN